MDGKIALEEHFSTETNDALRDPSEEFARSAASTTHVEPDMTHYRIYLLDADGRIISGRDATCSGDNEVRVTACTLANPYQRAEIWTGTRLVGRIKGE